MNLLDMAAALICATLAGTGVGGGGLFIIYLTAVTDVPQTNAQAINLVFFLAAVTAALPLQMKGRKISPRLILTCALFGIVGTLFGTRIRTSLPEDILRMLFGIMLVFAGLRTLFKGKSESGGKSGK